MRKRLLTGLTLGLTLASCAPSQQEIQEMVDNVPLQKRHSLVIDYDTKLLRNIDSLAQSGHKLEEAIRDGHDLTWEQACQSMPKEKDWKGEEYVVYNEAKEQQKKSREEIREVKLRLRPLIINGKVKNTLMPTPVTTYKYHPEYRDSLAREIKIREKFAKDQQPNTQDLLIKNQQTR